MEFQEPQGIYQQIAEHLCAEVLRGTREANARVPSVRDFAAQIAVNPNTVLRSYMYLEELGVLYNRRGIGYFVHENARSRIIDLKRRDFLTKTLPAFFREMESLHITLDEVEAKYNLHRAQPPTPQP